MAQDENWETLTVAGNEAMAELLQQELEKAKIPCVIEPEGASAFQGAAATFEIKVPKDHLEKAKGLLK
jgi:hypothetical protein